MYKVDSWLMSRIARVGSLLLVCTVSWSMVQGQSATPAIKDKVQIPDAEVRDQHGRKLHLYSDLIKDRIVVVNFFFTSCTFVCAPQGRALAKLQERLGTKMGKEVFFVSISKDPQVDTVDRLRRWAKEFGVKSGWTLVTGEPGTMEKVLWELFGERAGPGLHHPLLFVGNDKTGEWKTAASLSAPDKVIEIIDLISTISKHSPHESPISGYNRPPCPTIST